jgi:hypothetical protein
MIMAGGSATVPKLEEKLEERLKEQIEAGNVSLSSRDFRTVADSATTVDAVAEVRPREDPVSDRADVDVDSSLAASVSDPGVESLSIELTEDDKNAFLDALVSGDRFRRTVSAAGGRLVLVFRSRTEEETNAILTHLARLAQDGTVPNGTSYGLMLRSALLAAQVQRMNDIEFPELAGPMYRTVVNGKTVEPAWIPAMSHWNSLQAGTVAIVYRLLQAFEDKYWALVAGATDQNFFSPGGSI